MKLMTLKKCGMYPIEITGIGEYESDDSAFAIFRRDLFDDGVCVDVFEKIMCSSILMILIQRSPLALPYHILLAFT